MQFKNIDVTKVSFWVTLIISVILLVTGFFVPPRGEISPSVLTATGELFAFAALSNGVALVREGYTAHIKTNNVDVSISGDSTNTCNTEND